MSANSAIANLMPLIMAGGAGTRLWPLSRKLYPKQFQAIHPDGVTPFQAALELAERVAGRERIQRVTAQEQRFLAARQSAGRQLPNPIWTEPSPRGTAAVAALAAGLADSGGEILLLMPADQHVADADAAAEAFRRGAALAAAGRLVVFGVRPETAETGFGYIEVAPGGSEHGRDVLGFHEKPDAETAAGFQRSGRHLWNSGIFMVRADVLEQQLRQFVPEVLQLVAQARLEAEIDADFARLPEQVWSQLPQASFDRAVVEKSQLLSVVDFDVGWSDLGAFDRLWQIGEPDEHGNVASGNVVALDTESSYLHAHEGRLLAVLGVKDMAVVDSGDAVLVAPRSQGQGMRQMVADLSRRNGALLDNHVQVYRPWGSYIVLDAGATHLCKRLIVNPGAALSLQRHRHRSEHWVVVRGEAEVRVGEVTRQLLPNESVYVPKGEVHSLRNIGAGELELIEVQTGDTLSEDDIERLEDQYGRAPPKHGD